MTTTTTTTTTVSNILFRQYVSSKEATNTGFESMELSQLYGYKVTISCIEDDAKITIVHDDGEEEREVVSICISKDTPIETVLKGFDEDVEAYVHQFEDWWMSEPEWTEWGCRT